MAATLANAMAKSYTDDSSEDRIDKAHQAQRWLDERITDIQTKLRSAALAIQERRSRRDYRLRDSTKGKKIDRRKTKVKKSKLSLDELTSRKDTYKRIYESYLRAYTDSIHKQLYPKSSARIVSWATPSPFKSYPKTKIVLALSLILGVLLVWRTPNCAISSKRTIRKGLKIRINLRLSWDCCKSLASE